ncbi:MAG: diphthamide biosynthesis enzyme Dph2 [Candidatus Hodarchaeaceae archaeon]|nr:diphthamide biosynthesis enzyme Dph2 [Candidatus Hodarchaeaceae archaeon]
MRYDFEEGKVRQFLKRRKAKRAAVQLPSGLRPQLSQIIRVFEEAGVKPVIMAGSCYGACDLADMEAKRLGCDVLVHYGHADMGVPTRLPTLYIEARVEDSPLGAVEQALPELKFRRVGLLTTVQHIGHINEVANFLRSRGIQPVIGKPGQRVKYPGQLLGCDFGCTRSIASRVDGFLYVGTGEFHAIGVALATGKEVVVVNPISGGLKTIASDPKDFLRKRRAMISRAAAGERFGVVVSTKPGQARFRLAAELVRRLRAKGREVYLAAVDEVDPIRFADFRFDALVCAACPRIPIDDCERFEQPILTPFEVTVALGDAPFRPYRLDEVRESDF